MCSVKEIYNISYIEAEFGISDLANQVREFSECNIYKAVNDPESGTNTIVLDTTMQVYTSLEIPVPSQDVADNNAYQLKQVCMTRGKRWQGRELRRDAVWVWITEIKLCIESEKCNIRRYNGQVIGLLNAVLILRGKSQKIYKLAYIMRLNWIGNRKPGRPKEMSYLGKFMSREGQNVV